ncbi:Pkinase-domain-containing protein [Jaminaea rosea]|uniref:non-specific serine/threonine protein kinase n=1 Tax=Jaminaea rosea TaxID=1569628 RepID=A0A316UV64_9BASI|nr:Pkinase-domain-containing protein [Jaminaea rosea]PWN29196.1 Pkinase-domain-containing protein [Jaminaea rosea]
MSGMYAPSTSSSRQRASTFSTGPRYSPASMTINLSAGASAAPSGTKATLNQRAALVSAYNELGKELASTKLKAVGNYTLGRSIGEGTFGKVRMGTHRLTGTRVALKQVPKAHSASLTREIHHHRRLHHPHVMKLYEVLATESNIWMVSELCLGGELYDYLVERGTLPEAEARRIFGQLCLAVAYIHGKGIVHRDLKLENVLLDERCNVKLGDFGFTREFEGKRLMETFCGTTGYAAPEMLAGKKYTGEEVDIWSLGIILYALLSGSLPFDDDDESAMKSKILSGEYEMPPFLSEEARDLVQRILRLEPTQRPTLKSILSHPWFTKTIVATPMTTVEEDVAQGSYFQDSAPVPEVSPEARTNASLVAAQALTTGEEALTPAHAAETLAGLGVDLGVSSSNSVGSVSSISQSDDDSSGPPSETNTDPTSLDVSDKGNEGTEEVPVKRRSGAMQRNESQSTIRRDGSVGSDGTLSRRQSVSSRAARTLATHHEAGSGRDSRASTLHEAPLLVKRDSQSSSRGHHRTPSRTKRRSLSSGGLSDHHPPHLTNRPVDYCALLEQQAPALFSTPLEQGLLHQLGSLGMDVGQIVHSILTDACDASAAMWWLLKSKVEERQETERFLAPSGVTPSSSGSATIPAPPIPPKDPLRAQRRDSEAKDSDDGHRAMTRVEGLPSRAQDSFRRHVQPPTEAALPSAKVTEQPSKSSITPPDAAQPPLLSNVTASPPPRPSMASSIDDDGRNNGSPRQEKAARPRPSRDRTNSLSVKLASVLSGSRKENAPEVPTISLEDEAAPSGAERAKSPSTNAVASFFSRRPAGGIAAAKATGEHQRAISQPLPAKGLTTSVTENNLTASSSSAMPPPPVSKSMTPLMEGERTSFGSTSIEQSPSKSSSAKSSAGGHLPNSKSVDTFTTISSSKQSMTGDESLRSGGTDGSKKPSSSFFHTVKSWLGTEDKQARKQRKGKASAGTAASGKGKGTASKAGGLTLAGHGHDASTGMHRTGSVRSRVGPYSTPASSSSGGYAPNSSPTASRRYPRTPSNKTLTAHRLSASGVASATGLSLIDTHSASLARPSPLRRPSAGSITPTALYGERPSRAPSSSSLYRGSAPSGGIHTRAGSISSQHSGFVRHSSLVGGGGGLPSSTGSFRASPLANRRMSSDGGGTVVMRHRVRPRSEKSRPTSLVDTGDGLFSSSGGDDPTHLGSSTLGTGGGHATPRRWSIDSRREVDSRAGGRSSPLTPQAGSSSIFVAHRPRHHSYKPPSSNPSLFHHHHHHASSSSSSMSRRPHSSSIHSSNGTGGSDWTHGTGGAGVWRRSWGRPPPSWTGPIDDGPSRAELARIAAVARATSAGRTSLRDVFSGRRRKHLARDEEDGSVASSTEDWEDEDEDEDGEDDEEGRGRRDEPVFSGGLGQLDSASHSAGPSATSASASSRIGGAGGSSSPFPASRRGDNATSNGSVRPGYAPWKKQSPVVASSGSPIISTAGGGRKSWLPSQPGGSAAPNPFGKSAAPSSTTPKLASPSPSPSLAAYQTPQLGRDATPRMIAVSEDEEGEEEDDGFETIEEGATSADATIRGTPQPRLAVDPAGGDSASTSPVMGPSPNLPGSFVPSSSSSVAAEGKDDPAIVGLGLGETVVPHTGSIPAESAVGAGAAGVRTMPARRGGGGGSPLPPAVEEEEEEEDS